METPESIVAECIPDAERPVLKGGGRQLVKRGDMRVAKTDFDRLAPRNVEHRRGVTTGTLADGRTIVVRPRSEPTLEIQFNGRPAFKIRYRS